MQFDSCLSESCQGSPVLNEETLWPCQYYQCVQFLPLSPSVMTTSIYLLY